jgi:hypothetical protein
MTTAGFPHSEIPGSKLVCSCPRLIAACHVLRRLLAPRHPPCALSSLTGKFRSYPLVLGESALAAILRPGGYPEREESRLLDSQSSVVKDLVVATFHREGGSARSRDTRTGGDNRDRTGNLRLAKPALSQLSYIPKPVTACRSCSVVGLGRVELPTSRLSGVRSNHLSYRPLRSRRKRPAGLRFQVRQGRVAVAVVSNPVQGPAHGAAHPAVRINSARAGSPPSRPRCLEPLRRRSGLGTRAPLERR